MLASFTECLPRWALYPDFNCIQSQEPQIYRNLVQKSVENHTNRIIKCLLLSCAQDLHFLEFAIKKKKRKEKPTSGSGSICGAPSLVFTNNDFSEIKTN